MDEKDGVMEQSRKLVTWKHLSISIMQKSRFRNLHDVNEYFKLESLEPTTWPILHSPSSEPEVTHLLHSITVSVHLLLLLFLNSIESHPNPQTPFLTFYGSILNFYLCGSKQYHHKNEKKLETCKIKIIILTTK